MTDIIDYFCGVTAADVKKELTQWSVSGDEFGDEELNVNGIFYQESRSDIETALIRGGFPANLSDSTPIAKSYIAALHRKLTALLYIQAHRLNLLADGSDVTRGQWGAIRKKLDSISRGEPFGELGAPSHSVSCSYFYGDAVDGLSPYRCL